MSPQAFGGPWTEDKLNSLAAYLRAYTTLFQANERARKLTRIFVDAFAGSGYRTPKSRRKAEAGLALFPELLAAETQKFLKGSARIALEVEPSFHRYIFIERDKKHAKELEALKKEFPGKADRIKIVPEEANEYLRRSCAGTDWRYTRASFSSTRTECRRNGQPLRLSPKRKGSTCGFCFHWVVVLFAY